MGKAALKRSGLLPETVACGREVFDAGCSLMSQHDLEKVMHDLAVETAAELEMIDIFSAIESLGINDEDVEAPAALMSTPVKRRNYTEEQDLMLLRQVALDMPFLERRGLIMDKWGSLAAVFAARMDFGRPDCKKACNRFSALL
ncbi:hypothetical protein H310_12389 [Aphanomyces invadans]|uniref:Myb-like domain-containing protein n=1 Tax=Aphanomyces invadans TaxID=157072 RepID=A0A024TKG7_9STRA|nr:hypothetical protein H310_12389 [Aphanomyces invadans]ETV93827.1 hypothetical protein H310_12389 [Aphanomyces invadans]|eukprot:XP_008877636.1 hypothetical protein H310_12389 [Aphanomyces invadans]